MLVLFCCCKKTALNDTEKRKQEIIKVDEAMSEMAVKQGFNTSILLNADENLVKLEEGKQAIIGKKAFALSFEKDKDLKTISWVPHNAEVAQSGELAYTWGDWQYVAKDTTFYGNYFTVWKKDFNGDWKVVLDGGNNTPKGIN